MTLSTVLPGALRVADVAAVVEAFLLATIFGLFLVIADCLRLLVVVLFVAVFFFLLVPVLPDFLAFVSAGDFLLPSSTPSLLASFESLLGNDIRTRGFEEARNCEPCRPNSK